MPYKILFICPRIILINNPTEPVRRHGYLLLFIITFLIFFFFPTCTFYNEFWLDIAFYYLWVPYTIYDIILRRWRFETVYYNNDRRLRKKFPRIKYRFHVIPGRSRWPDSVKYYYYYYYYYNYTLLLLLPIYYSYITTVIIKAVLLISIWTQLGRTGHL